MTKVGHDGLDGNDDYDSKANNGTHSKRDRFRC